MFDIAVGFSVVESLSSEAFGLEVRSNNHGRAVTTSNIVDGPSVERLSWCSLGFTPHWSRTHALVWCPVDYRQCVSVVFNAHYSLSKLFTLAPYFQMNAFSNYSRERTLSNHFPVSKLPIYINLIIYFNEFNTSINRLQIIDSFFYFLH